MTINANTNTKWWAVHATAGVHCKGLFNKTASNTLHYPKSKLHFHMPGNSKSLQEDLVEPQLDNRDSMY